MIVLGLILLALVAAVTIIAVTSGGNSVHLHLHWFTVGTNGTFLFLAGAVSVVVAIFSLWLLRVGLRRSLRQRREIKALRQRAEGQRAEPGPKPPAAGSPPPAPRRQDADDYYDTAPRD